MQRNQPLSYAQAQHVYQTCHNLHKLLIISSPLSFRMDYESAGVFYV